MKAFFSKIQLSHQLIGLAILYFISFIIPIYQTTYWYNTDKFNIFNLDLSVSIIILVIQIGLVVLLFRKSKYFYNVFLLSLIMNVILFLYVLSTIFNYYYEDIFVLKFSFGFYFYVLVFVWNIVLFIYTMRRKESLNIPTNESKITKLVLYSLEIILIIVLVFYVFFFKLTPTEQLAFDAYEKISQEYDGEVGGISQFTIIERYWIDGEPTSTGNPSDNYKPRVIYIKVDDDKYIINISNGLYKGSRGYFYDEDVINQISLFKLNLRIELNSWFNK